MKTKCGGLEAVPHKERLMYPQADAEQIADILAAWACVPVDQMKSDKLPKITHLTEILGKSIKGQDTAIQRVHRHLLTARADLRRPGRPKGAFLLVGPSGVGKTETVVQLASRLNAHLITDYPSTHPDNALVSLLGVGVQYRVMQPAQAQVCFARLILR